MATVTSIVTGLQTALNTLSDVDQSSISDFLPPVKTQCVALCIVPLGQETEAEFEDLSGSTLVFSHRIPCEFWVKHDAGDVATTQQRAREIIHDAIKVLAQNDGTNYTLDFEFTFESQVSDQFIDVGNSTYLLATLIVPVRDEESI